MINIKELQQKYGKKTFLFLLGWFTIPSLNEGWIYDLFGTDSWNEIWQKVTHPAVWLDAMTVYTIAFLTFGHLPDKITQHNRIVKLIYFIIYYFVLLKIVKILFA